MPQNNLWSQLFKDFIHTLDIYRASHRTYYLSWYYTLSCSKLAFAAKLTAALQDYESLNDLKPLSDLAGKIERSNSDFTIPAHIISLNGFSTPSNEAFNFPLRCNTASSDIDVISQETDIEFYDVFWCYYRKLHGLRGARPVGRLDALVYAMSRSSYFTDYINKQINVDASEIAADQNPSSSFVELLVSDSDLNAICKDAIRLTAYYLSCLCFDRALARFATLRQVDANYYLDSGIYEAMIINRKPLAEIDATRDLLIRYLILLDHAYENCEEARDFILKYLLIGDEISNDKMLIPLILTLVPVHSKFYDQFNAIYTKISAIFDNANTGDEPSSEWKILKKPTAEFIDHDEEIPFTPQDTLSPVMLSASAWSSRTAVVCPSPLPPRTTKNKIVVS